MAENLYKVIGESSVDNLIYDTSFPVTTKSVKIKKVAAPLKRGTVLGVITATGYAVPADSTKTDGSQVADCILTDDVDASAGDVAITAYASGKFNRKALIFGGTDTTEKHETKLRELGIYLADTLSK